MKKTLKSIVLGLIAIGALAGCDFSSQSNTSSEATSSSETSLNSSESVVTKTNIVLTATKTSINVNEELTITSNVEGVTYSVSEGASINNGVFSATKEGEYTVTAHKDGDFVDGALTITVKLGITLSAEKTVLDVNESVAITSNVEGVTFTTTEGASVVNGLFSATKEGEYTVTAHKDGFYTDGTIKINVAFDNSVAKVKAILKQIKEGENYTLTSKNLLGENKIYRTKNYFFDTQIGEGQALFTNIIPNTKFAQVAHYIKLVDNNIVVGADVVYQTKSGDINVATDMYESDGFYYVNIDELKLEGNNGVYYTDDEDMIFAFSALLSSYAPQFASKIEFSFDKNYNLNARIIFIDPYTNEIIQENVDAFGYLAFTNIGTTVAPVVDELIKNVTVSDKGMSEEVASSFMLKEGHIKTTAKTVITEQEDVLAVREYNFNDKYLVEKMTKDGATTDKLYVKNAYDYACYVGIAPDNTVVEQAAQEWESFAFPYASLDLDLFRQTGEHTYSYMGYEPNGTASKISWINLNEQYISYITAYEENGKIVSIVSETENQLFNLGTDEDPIYAYGKIVLESEILPYEEIVAPTPFEADADTVRIQAYLDEVYGADANYQMFVSDQAKTSDWKNIKVTKETILVQEYSGGKTTYHGYHTLSDGVIEFSATADGDGKAVAKLVKEIELKEGQSLISLIAPNVAPETMKFDVNGNIVFKEDVLNAGNALFKEFKYPSYAMKDSVIFKVSSDHISNISFRYGNDEKYTEYAMLYTSSFGTTKLNGNFELDLVEKLNALKEAPKPTSWAEELPAFYEKLVAMVGEENMQYIPYIYDKNYSGHFVINFDKDTTKSVKFDNNTLSFSNEYRAAIQKACLEKGFSQNGTNQYSAYLMIGEYKLTVGTTGSQFSVIYKKP